MAIGEQVLSYDNSHYLVSALDLPLMGRVYSESRHRPYVALNLELDPGLLTELIMAMPPAGEDGTNALALSITTMTEEVRDALRRILTLLDHPGEIPILAPMLERELLFRLLQGPNGKLLRQIASPRGALSQVRRAVGWISENFDRPLKIDEVCEACGMSRASLHRNFRAVTGQSPLQYQKQLRLLEARRLLMAGEHNTSAAGFAVGYESSSQFSREYLRQFDTSPSKDMPRRQQEKAVT
ncbi:AraC-like DNA-binding protein [Paraburkholderia sp. 32]